MHLYIQFAYPALLQLLAPAELAGQPTRNVPAPCTSMEPPGALRFNVDMTPHSTLALALGMQGTDPLKSLAGS